MKQATQERFIVDVLENFTPIQSYYKLMKTVEDDPEFDVKRASKKLRTFVEGNDHAIRLKSEIMVDHFHSQVIAKRKIGGEARAMVVTSSIPRCIEYFHAISAYLAERKSPYKAIVAFSGEHEYKGIKVTEASLNGFPSKDIAERIQDDPYRILVCADKFQTGYDEPLLHTMYVDKTLSNVKAVQTLSRLNRVTPSQARRLRARLRQRRRRHRASLRAVLPDHGAEPGDRSGQAARPGQRAERLPRLHADERRQRSSSSTWPAPIATSSIPSSTSASPSTSRCPKRTTRSPSRRRPRPSSGPTTSSQP